MNRLDNGCWEWSAGRVRRKGANYGRFAIEGTHVRTHRLAWELTHGAIPEGLWVLHRCDNPPCCNPDHLYLGTVVENVRDMHERGRYKPPYRGRTHCIRGHEYVEPNFSWRLPRGNQRYPSRVCRICAGERTVEWRIAQRVSRPEIAA
jgi:hypothetical protein